MEPSGPTLIESKLHVPRRRRGLVPRARLGERLSGDDLPAVTLVAAPAGFGKTTVLTEWLDALPETAAWVSLDRRDSDPAVFWTYLIEALRRARPEVGAAAAEALLAAPSDLERVVTALSNDLVGLQGDVVLVLDDYHVIDSLDVHESMLFLVEHMPPPLHLVIAGRADPPWPLGGLRARGDLVEVRADDLRFTASETAAYLNDAMGLALTAADIEALDHRTEGWAAALQLAALSLQGRDDPSDFIAGFAGDDRFVVDYLVDEVLDRQDEDIRTFLLQTSILARLSAPLCAAVTGRDDARAALDTLERSNLFLVSLDDRRRWYRYHHLFADVLRARLTDEQPDLVAGLHRRACEWFDAHGDRHEAIRHALAAGDFDRAADIVEVTIPALSDSRQDVTLRGLVDAIPPEVLVNRPVLRLGWVGAHMVTGEVEGVATALDAIEAWLEAGSPEGETVVRDAGGLERLPAQTSMYRAALALMGGDLAGTVEHARRAGALSPPDDHLGRGAAVALMGLAAWSAGDLVSAEQGYTEAIASFEEAGRLADVLGCSLGLSDMQVAQGRLGAASDTLTRGIRIGEEHGPLRGLPDMYVGLSEIHLERNELEQAARQLEAGRQLDERLALPQFANRSRLVEARLRSIAGDHETALRLALEAEQRYDTDYSPPVRPATATTARLRLAAGDTEGALRWAAGSGIAATDEPSYVREYEHLTLARVLLASGGHSQARPLLERVLVSAEAGGRTGSVVDALVQLALVGRAAGDTTAALASIERALVTGEAERFVRTFLDAGASATALLEDAVRHDRAAPQAKAVLTGVGSAPAEPTSHGLVDELSPRELDVLRLLRSDLSGPEIAAELVVSLNTVRTHTKNIFMKLGVNSRRAAVRRAQDLGI